LERLFDKGNQIMKKLIATAALALVSNAVNASTITTLPLWDTSTAIGTWGGGRTNTYGEVLAAAGNSLTSFTFEVNNRGVAGTYAAQVYAWFGSTTSGGPVGSALYTGALTSLDGLNGFQAITTDTGGVAVTSGQTYAILLYDGSGDAVAADWGLTPPFGAHPDVPGDVGFFFNNGPSNVNGTFGDFGSLAYSATFTDGVPEAPTWGMLITGFGLVGFAARRRRITAIV
jgi:hypothetical protein